jgi:multisubunit Na+/H+ antiporter MnhG subunit
MKFLAKLATGQIALWRVYWFIGTPLTLIWLLTGAAIVFLAGIPSLLVVGSIIGVFALATLTIPFAAWAIWRSASNYSRKTWRQTALAWGAKASAVFWTLVALATIYGLYDYVLPLIGL